MSILIICIICCMGLVLIRMAIGPTIYDRILAVNMFGTYTVVMIVLLSVFKGNSSFIDVALIYGLINFITTIALLRYFTQQK